MKNSEQPINPIDGSHQGIHPKAIIGLTKREYFAGLAMQGLLSIYDNCNNIAPNYENIEYMATLSVKASDELLKALEQ